MTQPTKKKERLLTDIVKNMYRKEIDDLKNDRDVNLLSFGDLTKMISDVSRVYFAKLNQEEHKEKMERMKKLKLKMEKLDGLGGLDFSKTNQRPLHASHLLQKDR